MAENLGLIAGAGNLPLLLAQEIRRTGTQINTVAFYHHTTPELERYVDKIYWTEIGLLQPLIDFFIHTATTKVILAGKIAHQNIFNPALFDLRGRKVLAKLPDFRTLTILQGLADEFATEHIELVPCTDFLQNHIAENKILTSPNTINAELTADFKFGYTIAKHIADKDIGQTVIVKNRTVIAVEAMEGTDECIRRASNITSSGLVIVKVARPNQDLRFDVPIIGLNTLRTMDLCSVYNLGVEAQKTIILDKEQFYHFANSKKMYIVGLIDGSF